MELKNYQKKVMDNLTSYMDCLDRTKNISKAWDEYWKEQEIPVGFGGVPSYNDAISGVPHVCMKVPTGGGKTFMACTSIKRLTDALPSNKPKVVVWLVPSDSILTQTITTLSNPNHPYRHRLDMDFAGRVGVYTKEQLLSAQNFSPDTVRDMLTLCIFSYASLRIDSKKKDVRKVFQENGNLKRFADLFADDSILLADTPETALIQVIRDLEPVVVVDESHNAGSDLSVEMLNNLNPSFVLDLTATPRKNSNIISYVDARELKKENMVKLPVVVYNRSSRQNVIQDAIQLRGSIENQAILEEQNGGEYIRPIVLFQAQPKTSNDSDTFEAVKDTLIKIGIPKEQIAIKTSKVDDLGNVDLLSRNCPIRYIITVNALKEGWDCPFAYILASLANKTSTVDVEQILGRVLRQPYTKKHSMALLNTSYVLTSSNDFRNTLDRIVDGLNKAGFSKKDYRVGNADAEMLNDDSKSISTGIQIEIDEASELDKSDFFDDVSTEEIKDVLEQGQTDSAVSSSLLEMMREAEQRANEYSAQIDGKEDDGFIGGELGEMLKQYAIQSQYSDSVEGLRLPQFYLKTTPDLFGDEYSLLQPENLSEGFSLAGADANISFELATGEMYSIDVHEEGIPKYMRVSASESQYLRNVLSKMPAENRITNCADMIAKQINKNDRYATKEVISYVKRIIDNMTDDEISAMENAIPFYARKIQDKIEQLEAKHREEIFYKWLDADKIACLDRYEFPKVITPSRSIDSIPYSLYESERDDMNEFERKALDSIISIGNIEWWHRIIDRGDREFKLNGFINHYPDFIFKTKQGNLILVETKGDHLASDDSLAKLSLGRSWQDRCGQGYKYFMVFNSKDFLHKGAYTLDKFIEIIKQL